MLRRLQRDSETADSGIKTTRHEVATTHQRPLAAAHTTHRADGMQAHLPAALTQDFREAQETGKSASPVPLHLQLLPALAIWLSGRVHPRPRLVLLGRFCPSRSAPCRPSVQALDPAGQTGQALACPAGLHRTIVIREQGFQRHIGRPARSLSGNITA